jgi:hypothetical protein
VRQFTVTITHDGETDDAFDVLFRQYLTTPDYPFLVDYGPDEWNRRDGYDGPKVYAITVEPVS